MQIQRVKYLILNSLQFETYSAKATDIYFRTKRNSQGIRVQSNISCFGSKIFQLEFTTLLKVAVMKIFFYKNMNRLFHFVIVKPKVIFHGCLEDINKHNFDVT